jgi:two-component system cell cycle sensor histidine kinase/response regulator CckA
MLPAVFNARHYITRLTGHTVDEWIGTKLSEHCDEENFMKLGQIVTAEISKGPDGNGIIVEATMLKKNKDPIAVEINGKVIYGQDGTPQALQGVSRDITERREAKQSLEESERRLSTLMANLPGMAYRCTNSHNWTMEFISEGCTEITGYSPEDLVGNKTRSYADLIHPQDRQRVWDRVQEAVSAERPFELEYRIHTRHGEEKWLWERGIGVPSKRTDEIKLEGFISDVSERKRAEHALQESELRYRVLVDNLQVGISVINPKMEIVAINKFFQEYYPHVRPGEGQLCYKTYNDPPSPSPCSYCPCVQTLQDGMVHETVTDTPAGDVVRNYRVVSCPIMDHQGNVELVIELVEDITESIALQAQLAQAQKMEAVGTLAGGVAHDFNNILQVALGYSELILGEEGLPKQYRADLKKIHESSKRGADLVHRLLTFSRKTEIKLQPINLNRRIDEMRKMVERIIPKMIDIELILAEDLATINADPTQVDQVIMNLAVNARDAMSEGGKLIFETANIILDEEYAKTHLDTTPGRYVLLMVTDTGAGMDKETLGRIFEPFYTTKTAGEGTGLGLAMVHGIVKQHGGHIGCYSEPGHGTTFKIYLPALVSEEEEGDKIELKMPRGGSETILLVDDEELIRDLGSRILKKAGYKVVTASDGEKAEDIYKERADEIALVVLDVIMPGMGGKKCLEALLSLDPSVKVVIASGFSADFQTRETLAAGAKGFVNKPYDIRQVLAVVREVLDATQ